MDFATIRKAVRENYGAIARQVAGNCGCCGGGDACDTGKALGYSDEQLQAAPEGANLGLGCGNPTALGTLSPGETVLDLGSGAGFDCFLAAERVGSSGRVIGVDMTPDMIEKARANAVKSNAENVEFRLGEIEHLPVADNTVDAIISNCVINLTPDKAPVFREAHRVLKPGGRLMISDIVLKGKLPPELEAHMPAIVGCISGAIQLEDYLELMRQAGFSNIEVAEENKDLTGYWLDTMVTDELLAEMGVTREEAMGYAKIVVSAGMTATK